MRSVFVLAVALGVGCVAPTPTEDPTPASDPEPPWPAWTHEHWVWEDESTQESVLALVDGYLERDIPVGAVIIDSPWETAYNDFNWDPALYPDPQGMVDDLHERGVRIFLWITQMVNVDAGQVWDDGVAGGYFMQELEEDTEPAVLSWWKGEGALVDFANPAAVTWWRGLMDPVLELGIDGWKTDGSDFLAAFAGWSPAAQREIGRLEYSHSYYQEVFDYTRQVLGDDRLITSRPIDNYGIDLGGDGVAFSPVDITWAGWVGDQDADFSGIRAALLNFWHSAAYGYVVFGSDIGGYREDGSELGRTKEVLLRWAGLGAFSPVMENGGGGAHEPWRFDEETVDIYRRFVELHDALSPYLLREGALVSEAGTSLMSFIDLDRTDFRYFLGPDLFVQPVLESTTSFEVRLPAGEWRWLFGDQRTLTGGQTVTLDMPLGAYPAFVRVDSRVADDLETWLQAAP